MSFRLAVALICAALAATPAWADDEPTRPPPPIAAALLTAGTLAVGAAVGWQAAALDAERSADGASRYDRQAEALGRASDRQEMALGFGIGGVVLLGAAALLWWLGRDTAPEVRQARTLDVVSF